MILHKEIDELRKYLKENKSQGKSIGLVPTMGFLHEGHISLINKAAEENDIVVVSIFVNPTQFGPNEDFEDYPRDLSKDMEISQKAGANIIFAPSVNEMYPHDYNTYVEVEKITELLCGSSRPVHFKGVTTVVSKLFNIINPNKAYFGQKDAQQSIVIKRMVQDLNIDIDIEVCPIIRESDGLAKSSRNVYLNTDERKEAIILSESLLTAKNLINSGEHDVTIIKNKIRDMLNSKPLANIEYIEILDGVNLDKIKILEGKVLIALAVKFGNTRLIDNIIIEV